MGKPVLLERCLYIGCLAVRNTGVQLMTKSNLTFMVAF